MKVKYVVIISCLLLLVLSTSCAKSPEEDCLNEVIEIEELEEVEKPEENIEQEPVPEFEDVSDIEAAEEDTTVGEEKLKEYAQIIENTSLRNHLFDGHNEIPYSKGIVETDFYYDKQNDRIAFRLNGYEDTYYFYKIKYYDIYSVGRYRHESKPFDILEADWLGTYEINTDFDDMKYELPELTEEDRKDIELVCNDLYERFSSRQDTFEYDVYGQKVV